MGQFQAVTLQPTGVTPIAATAQNNACLASVHKNLTLTLLIKVFTLSLNCKARDQYKV